MQFKPNCWNFFNFLLCEFWKNIQFPTVLEIFQAEPDTFIGIYLFILCYIGFECCESYDVDVEKFTELWLTFCVNNNTDIDPTIDTLVKMEHSVLKKDYKLHSSTTESHTKQEQSTKRHFIANETGYHYSENDDVLSMYGCAESGPPKVSFHNCFLL